MTIKTIVPIGTKFGFLEYLGKDETRKGKTYHLCKCVCGKIKYFDRCSLINGKTKSCGCKSKELCKQNRRCTKTHGDSKTEFYKRYYLIRNRCTNIKDKNRHIYGGRGIKCERNTYKDFKKDMYKSYLEHIKIYGEQNTTIDRIDYNGNYNKDNCRWSTRLEQGNNKTTNLFIEYKGQKYSLKDLCRKLGKNYGMILQRIQVSKRPIDYALRFPPTPLNMRNINRDELFKYFISLGY